MLDLLKKLYAGGQSPDTVAQLAPLVEELDKQAFVAEQRLAAERAGYGKRLANCQTPADMDRLDRELDGFQVEHRRLTAAREEMRGRLSTAQEREAATALDAGWKGYEAACEARHAALAKVTSAAEKLASAVLAAEKIAQDAWEATPVRRGTSGTASSFELMPQFVSLRGIARHELALAFARVAVAENERTQGAVRVDSADWDLVRTQTLVEESRSAAATVLQLREQPLLTAA